MDASKKNMKRCIVAHSTLGLRKKPLFDQNSRMVKEDENKHENLI